MAVQYGGLFVVCCAVYVLIYALPNKVLFLKYLINMVLICTIMCQEWMIVFAQFIEIFSCLELLKMNVILMK